MIDPISNAKLISRANAAKLLGVHPSGLTRVLKTHDVRPVRRAHTIGRPALFRAADIENVRTIRDFESKVCEAVQ